MITLHEANVMPPILLASDAMLSSQRDVLFIVTINKYLITLSIVKKRHSWKNLITHHETNVMPPIFETILSFELFYLLLMPC